MTMTVRLSVLALSFSADAFQSDLVSTKTTTTDYDYGGFFIVVTLHENKWRWLVSLLSNNNNSDKNILPIKRYTDGLERRCLSLHLPSPETHLPRTRSLLVLCRSGGGIFLLCFALIAAYDWLEIVELASYTRENTTRRRFDSIRSWATETESDTHPLRTVRFRIVRPYWRENPWLL